VTSNNQTGGHGYIPSWAPHPANTQRVRLTVEGLVTIEYRGEVTEYKVKVHRKGQARYCGWCDVQTVDRPHAVCVRCVTNPARAPKKDLLGTLSFASAQREARRQAWLKKTEAVL
jgi:hypothetical protein